VLPRLDATISVAESVRDDAVDLGARSERAYTIPNGIPVARVLELGTAEKIAFRRPTVVAVGRLAYEKGFDILLRAHASAQREIAHDLVLVGDGRERTSLERLATELGVGGSVTFAGYRPNPYPWIAAADLVCLPSRHEASPLIIPEALALCRPVVATDCPGGTHEALAEGRFGQLVPCGDLDALAEAIAAHLKAPGRLRGLATVAQAEIAGNSDVAVTAARYAEVLRQVLENSHCGKSGPARRGR
jgi:glycosyltransferase involved in cell wall biosynthesis